MLSFVVSLVLIFLVHIEARATERTSHRYGESIVRSFMDSLPPELLSHIIEESYYVNNHVRSLPSLLNGKYRTFWLPYSSFPPEQSLETFTFDPSKSAIEQAIALLRNYALPNKHTVGAEWWFQVVDGTEKGTIGWHVDKDESVASNQMYLSHPELASILYLTNEGGPTCITDQWSPHGNQYSPLIHQQAVMSFPEPNKYTVFHGELLHGVLPGQRQVHNVDRYVSETPIHPVYAESTHKRPRITFLINWWTYKPVEPNCIDLKLNSFPPFVQLYKKRQEERNLKATLEDASCLPQQGPFPPLSLSHSTKPLLKKLVSKYYNLSSACEKIQNLSARGQNVLSTGPLTGLEMENLSETGKIIQDNVPLVVVPHGRSRSGEFFVGVSNHFPGENLYLSYKPLPVPVSVSPKKEKKKLSRAELRQKRAMKDKMFL